jgi:asparagine synthetase B (glutamine-hydrolysing)
MYYAINGKRFGVASWPLPLKQLQLTNIQRIEMNAAIAFDMTTFKQIKKETIYTYDLCQYKTSYDDLLKAIQHSIKVRSESSHLTPFVTLSSGYDSGTIACECLNQQKKCNYLSLKTPIEDMNVLAKRFEMNKDGELVMIERKEFNSNDYKYILDIYNQNFGTTEVPKNIGDNILIKKNKIDALRNDRLASSFLFHTAMKHDYKLHLSGLGADTIFSDLCKKYPKNLADVIPKTTTDTTAVWKLFWDHGENPRREEFFASMFGIQTRYPFIDKYVVQEFLNLDVSLKNKYYKAPLRVYLEKHKYPFALGKKAGLWINA